MNRPTREEAITTLKTLSYLMENGLQREQDMNHEHEEGVLNNWHTLGMASIEVLTELDEGTFDKQQKENENGTTQQTQFGEGKANQG